MKVLQPAPQDFNRFEPIKNKIDGFEIFPINTKFILKANCSKEKNKGSKTKTEHQPTNRERTQQEYMWHLFVKNMYL